MSGSVGVLPLFWRDESTGILGRAVQSYLTDQTGGREATAEEIKLVVLYLDQWIHASCWTQSLVGVGDDDGSLAGELVGLRKDVKLLATADQVHSWLMRALDFGIDPL